MCSNCDVLRARVRELEETLGLRTRHGCVAALVGALGVPASCARVLLVLHGAKGRHVHAEALLALGFSSMGQMRKTITEARRALGENAVLTAWGAGYALSAAAFQRISQVLA